MKRKAESESDVPNIGTIFNSAEDKPPKKPKGKAKASQNEQDWPEYFQTVSESTISFRDSWLMSLNV
jgi:hypothetical protein